MLTEEMLFEGAPVAHIALFYARMRDARRRQVMARAMRYKGGIRR